MKVKTRVKKVVYAVEHKVARNLFNTLRGAAREKMISSLKKDQPFLMTVILCDSSARESVTFHPAEVTNELKWLFRKEMYPGIPRKK